MASISKDKWGEARIRWEADPRETFESIGQWLGVSRAAVHKHAKANGWEKAQSMGDIALRAQKAADAAALTPVVDASTAQVDGVTQKRAPLQASVEQAIDLRSKVIQMHRAEWRKHANLFPLDDIKDDFDVGRKAKISSEVLAIRQKCERAAWGLDQFDEERASKATPTVIRLVAETAQATGVADGG